MSIRTEAFSAASALSYCSGHSSLGVGVDMKVGGAFYVQVSADQAARSDRGCTDIELNVNVDGSAAVLDEVGDIRYDHGPKLGIGGGGRVDVFSLSILGGLIYSESIGASWHPWLGASLGAVFVGDRAGIQLDYGFVRVPVRHTVYMADQDEILQQRDFHRWPRTVQGSAVLRFGR